MSAASIIVVGSLNVDYVMRVPTLPRPGETLSGSGFDVLGGGKGANQGLAAARLGGDVSFVGCIGTDDGGASLKAVLKDAGTDVANIRSVSDEPTGAALIFVDDSGENCIGVNAGANAALSSDDIQNAANDFGSAGFLLVQLETPTTTVRAALALAQQHGLKCVLNPAPAAALDDDLLALVDVITPNETEAETLTGIAVTDEASAKRAASVLHERGIGTVIITMGAAGALLSADGQALIVPAPSVDVVDTTAAGDTFNGALVAALARGESLEQAVAFGNRAAAISVTRFGAQPSIPTLDEVS
ncbi:MAG: ribokinase [Pseudomonadaceae bacterium]|nr:ribokinase [Pseudomonadaceae bacterium]